MAFGHDVRAETCLGEQGDEVGRATRVQRMVFDGPGQYFRGGVGILRRGAGSVRERTFHRRVAGDDRLARPSAAVTDLGKGIPPEDLDRIFEKFYRRGKPDGRAPGTGLGLSIARGFVEAMGGRIHAESPALKKRGTRIVMRFPAGGEDKDAIR